MLFIDNDVCKRVLTMDECIRVQEEAILGMLTRDSVHRTRIDVYVPSEQEDGYFRWGTMEGASKTLGVHAIRMKSDIVHWPRDEHGNWTEEKYCVEPGTYCGLIFLVSTRNGEPLAFINDGHLQHMRVAAGAGIGARWLARKNTPVVAMLGSGGMARTYLQAFCAVRDVETVRVFSPTRGNREAYAAEMSEMLGLDVRAVDTAEDAVRGADIVSTCTDSMNPVIQAEWLEPGMHVTNLGPFELPETVFKRADVVIKQGPAGVTISDAEQRVEIGRGHSPVAYIGGSDEEVSRIPAARETRFFEGRTGGGLPKFTDLASGHVPGRTTDEQISVYLAGGYQGLQFAATGWLAYERARAAGLGRQLPTEWFLQDIRD